MTEEERARETAKGGSALHKLSEAYLRVQEAAHRLAALRNLDAADIARAGGKGE